MQRWDIQEQFIEVKPRRAPGCMMLIILSVMGVIGLLITAGIGLYLYNVAQSGEVGEGALFAALLLLLSQLLFIAIFNQFNAGRGGHLRIDRTSQTISCLRRDASLWEVKWSALCELKLIRFTQIKHTEGSHRARKTYTYQLFFTLLDGAHLWVDTYHSHDEAREHLETMTRFIGDKIKLKVSDSSKGAQKSARGGHSITQRVKSPADISTDERERLGYLAPHNLSRFIIAQHDEDGSTSYQLTEDKSPLDRYVYLLIFTFFFTILGAGWVMGLSLLSVTGWFAAVFIPLFVVVMSAISLTVLAFFLGSKKYYTLHISSSELTLRMHLRLSWLNRYFERSLTLPHSAVRGLRVSRLDQGHLWLSLVLNPDADTSALEGSLVHSMTSFDTAQLTQAGEREVGVWHLCALHREGDGCTLSDLRYVQSSVANMLQRSVSDHESTTESEAQHAE